MDALSILALGVAQAGGGGGGGTSDYSDLSNKPQINNVTLNGNKSLSDLGIQGEIEGNSISPSQIEMTGLNSFVDITPDNGISVASGAPGMPDKGIFINPGMNTVDIIGEDLSQQGMMPMASLGVSQNSELTVNGSAVAMKSDIPTVNNARLTIRRNGVAVRSFTANDNVDRSADILVPENTSDLTNDSGFITLSDVPKELPTISTGDAGKVLTVNSGETGVEWAAGGGGGGSYTFTNGLTESSGTVSYDYNDVIKAKTRAGSGSHKILELTNADFIPSSSGSGLAKSVYTLIGSFEARTDALLPYTVSAGTNVTGNAVVGSYKWDTTETPSGYGGVVGFGGSGSTVIGYHSVNSGDAYSYGVIADGEGNAIIGYSNKNNAMSTNGNGAVVIGCTDVAGSRSQGTTMSANGKGSVAVGYCTHSLGDGQLATGKFNVKDTSRQYAFIVGNGSNNTNRSNALTVDWNGNLVCNNIPACPSADGVYNLQVSIVSGVPTYSWVAQS